MQPSNGDDLARSVDAKPSREVQSHLGRATGLGVLARYGDSHGGDDLADDGARLRQEAKEADRDVATAVAFASDTVAAVLPAPPGRSVPSARRLFGMLASIAEGSTLVARVVEPHLDAQIILRECPEPIDLGAVGADSHSTWGVFAAEGPGSSLMARDEDDDDTDASSWRLSGRKPWCSLADTLSHALVTAPAAGSTTRRLFAVDLRHGVTAHPETWLARGLPEITSAPADFADAVAVPVGEAGWYLERPGFEWGGIRVAACWAGAARGLADTVRSLAADRDSDLLWMHAGRIEGALHTAFAALGTAAEAIDSGRALDVDGGPAQLAQLTRTIVRSACETVLRETGHALGPAPFALDAWFAAQASDLELYLLQDHGERDTARLGRLSAAAGWPDWREAAVSGAPRASGPEGAGDAADAGATSPGLRREGLS